MFVRGGLAGWMGACPPSDRPRPLAAVAGEPVGYDGVRGLAAADPELVRVLAEMALSSRRRCPA